MSSRRPVLKCIAVVASEQRVGDLAKFIPREQLGIGVPWRKRDHVCGLRCDDAHLPDRRSGQLSSRRREKTLVVGHHTSAVFTRVVSVRRSSASTVRASRYNATYAAIDERPMYWN